MTGPTTVVARTAWTVVSVFWNADERRLRASWRIVLGFVAFAVLRLVTAIAFQVFALQALLATTLSPPIPAGALSTVGRTVSVLATAGALVGAVWLGGRILDRRPFADFGLHVDREWWFDLAFGLALGAGLMTAIFAVEVAAGWVTIRGTVVGSTGWTVGRVALVEVLAAFVLFVCVGIYEELVYRGYLLKNAAEGLCGVPFVTPRRAIGLATLFTAGLFGLVHANNPNATLASTTNIAIAGVFLAVGYVLTGELAIPIGIHITWNFFQRVVFGFPVSGATLGTSVVRIEQAGPTAVTGGPFGPEAGLIGLGAIVVGTLSIVAWVRSRYGRVALAYELTMPTLRWR